MHVPGTSILLVSADVSADASVWQITRNPGLARFDIDRSIPYGSIEVYGNSRENSVGIPGFIRCRAPKIAKLVDNYNS